MAFCGIIPGCMGMAWGIPCGAPGICIPFGIPGAIFGAMGRAMLLGIGICGCGII